MRRKQMSMAALSFQDWPCRSKEPRTTKTSSWLRRSGSRATIWKDAQKMEAGMHEGKVQNEQQQAQLTEQQKQIEANTARFGQLDDYNIWDRITVYFANGKVSVDQKYIPQLLALAEKAKTVNGYTLIEVKGYTSCG